MKARPILFSKPMIIALLNGRKTQTRRIFKGTTERNGVYNDDYMERYKNHEDWEQICPYGLPGDLLWVRESFRLVEFSPAGYDEIGECECDYRATPSDALSDYQGKWKPSIHMPRDVSRLTLKIKRLRVERVQDITEDDVHAEGCDIFTMGEQHAKAYFRNLWDSINGSWSENPLVWVIEFDVIQKNVDLIIARG